MHDLIWLPLILGPREEIQVKLGDGALGRPPAPEPWGFLPAEPCLSVPKYTQCMAHHGEHDDSPHGFGGKLRSWWYSQCHKAYFKDSL